MSTSMTVWDHMACEERLAPTKDELEAIEGAVMEQLSALGGGNAISVALDCIAQFLFAEHFVVGSDDLGKFLTVMVKHLVRRTREFERAQMLLPVDVRMAGIQ
jgi:hypothetical protein